MKLGRHLFVEFSQCNQEVLNNPEQLTEAMKEAAIVSGATYISHQVHQFTPYGVTVLILIAESHLAIHTWPEYGYAAVDIFTCGSRVDPWKAYHLLSSKLCSKLSLPREIARGIFKWRKEAPKNKGRSVTADAV